jgi:hypothetical protein
MLYLARYIFRLIEYITFHYITRRLPTRFRNIRPKLSFGDEKNIILPSTAQLRESQSISFEIHSWASPTMNEEYLAYHAAVFKQLNLKINYSRSSQPSHGVWITRVLRSTHADVIVFFDLDCVPLCRKIVEFSVAEAFKKSTLYGIAQVSNHISPASFIFCGPAFLVIDLRLYRKLGSPYLHASPWYDTAEYLSALCCDEQIEYYTLMPIAYHEEPSDRLHSIGRYGVGTYYDGGIFHLWRGREGRHLEIFKTVCSSVLHGSRFNLRDLIQSGCFGRISDHIFNLKG